MRYHELVVETKPKKPTPPSAGITKPKPPMTPAQSRRESERRAKVQDRIQDATAAHQEKLKDLRADL